jgi:hypothetical protein
MPVAGLHSPHQASMYKFLILLKEQQGFFNHVVEVGDQANLAPQNYTYPFTWPEREIL